MDLERGLVPQVDQVEAELAELWRSASTEEHPLIRACSHNLVVVCTDCEKDLQQATQRVADVSETAPGRALMIAPRAGSPQGNGTRGALKVYVSAHCHRGASGAQVCTEQVTLEARGEAAQLVPGTLLALLVEGLPVYTWWRRPLLARDELFASLCDLSDRLILDGSSWTDPASGLDELSGILSSPSWKGQITDLAWARLDPWREAIAAFFDAPVRHGALHSISSVQVTAGGAVTARGRTIAGAYFVGWLASRLGWERTEDGFRRPDGKPVALTFPAARQASAGTILSIALDAEDGTMQFLAERTAPDADFVRLSVQGGAGPTSRHAIKLPPHEDSAILCGALQLTGKDRIFAEALAEACHLVGA